MTYDHKALVDAFRSDGFVHIRGFLDRAQVDEVEQNLNRFIRDIVPTLGPADAMYQKQGQPETLKQIGCLEKDRFFSDFMLSDKVKGLAEVLLQQKVVPEAFQFFNKPPRVGTSTPPHQDGYYFCLEPNEALTIWIPLDDVNQENGAVSYWKGSHKKGVLPHGASYVLGFSQSLSKEPGTEAGTGIVCDVKRGDCLIHHSLTIHAAGPNTSPRTRRALGAVYFAERAKIDPEARRRYQESVSAQRSHIDAN